VPSRAGERLRRPETVELIHSYYAIADWQTRHEFLAMVKACASAHDSAPTMEADNAGQDRRGHRCPVAAAPSREKDPHDERQRGGLTPLA